MAFDSNQRFVTFVPGGQGILYAVQSDGVLYWYRHTGWQTGARTWASGNGRQIGSEWHQFTRILASQDGQLFAVDANGQMRWYQYILQNSGTGAGYWHPASGAVIGNGFDALPQLFGGWNGIMYGVDADGVLWWYRYTGSGGTPYWANGGNGLAIGSGWKEFSPLFADPNGVIYGARQGGDLRWYRRIVTNAATGAGYWANNGIPIVVGVGWGAGVQKWIASNTSGTIYAVATDTGTVPTDDSGLTWYRLLTSETVNTSGANWASNGTAVAIGSGFSVESTASLQGYPSALSVPQGGSVGIQVSSTFPTYTATVMREAPAPSASGAVQVIAPASHTGRLQTLPTGYRSAGCGWQPDFTVSVPPTWQSGVYTVRLTSPYGNTHPVMFVVRPLVPTAKIAVVLPTNTYNAYNFWGGHNQYSVGQDGLQRTVTLRRPSTSTGITDAAFINAALYADLFLLRWLTDEGIAYDVYEDGDLDRNGPTWLPSYKAVVLCSHPEYFTAAMRQDLVDFTANGGRLVYTGGNGVYEQMQFTADRSALIFRDTAGNRIPFDDLGLPTPDVLGVDYNAASYMDFAPYLVQTAHPFLNGTGLGVGDAFGTVAYNGAASGWEIDSAPSGQPGATVIASGMNPNGGADLTYTTKPKGGWVFAASSLSFNGAIPYDSAIQQILRNVFAAAVA